jgi:hypothetical protein
MDAPAARNAGSLSIACRTTSGKACAAAQADSGANSSAAIQYEIKKGFESLQDTRLNIDAQMMVNRGRSHRHRL